MVQARAASALNLRFAPMQASEAIAPIARDGDELDQGGLNLVLYPGESSDLLMLFENTSAEPPPMRIRLEGSCPTTWYQFQCEQDEIAAYQRIEGLLQFQVPASFFEDAHALRPQQTLTLDYHLDVVVTYEQPMAPEASSLLDSSVTQPSDQEWGRRSQRKLEYRRLNVFVRPRTRLMEFLPAIYREVDFMHRYLQIFEQALRPIFETTDALTRYLDPLTAPEALLPFLAHWVAWPMDTLPLMPSHQRRLIRNAMTLYRWRGTRRGLRLFLHYATGLPLDEAVDEGDRAIAIQESSSKAFLLGNVHLGPNATLGRGRPYHFIVTLRPDHSEAEGLPLSLIHRIITQEKPAHCTYDLHIEPRPNDAVTPSG
ncbi:MAG: phage tail protein [Cyanobacteria bacterium J06626_14]